MHRWKLVRKDSIHLYLDQLCGDIPNIRVHDYPKHFLSVGLAGSWFRSGKLSDGAWMLVIGKS